MRTKTIWLPVALTLAVALALAVRSGARAGSEPKKSCCHPPSGAATASAACPLHAGAEGAVIDDAARADLLRRTLRDGVFAPWMELGRAPTPDEIAARLHVDRATVDARLDQLAACGEILTVGVLRVPQSELIAVAWPLANVPTGITVTLDGGRPVFARCAVDALGVSKMLGKRATIVGEPREGGAPIRLVVDGERLISAEPPDAAVLHPDGACDCDHISFFRSRAAADRWLAAHPMPATVLSLDDAVRRGARVFGGLTKGL